MLHPPTRGVGGPIVNMLSSVLAAIGLLLYGRLCTRALSRWRPMSTVRQATTVSSHSMTLPRCMLLVPRNALAGGGSSASAAASSAAMGVPAQTTLRFTATARWPSSAIALHAPASLPCWSMRKLATKTKQVKGKRTDLRRWLTLACNDMRKSRARPAPGQAALT